MGDYQNDDRAEKDVILRWPRQSPRRVLVHAYTVRQTAVTDRQQPPARSVHEFVTPDFQRAHAPVRRSGYRAVRIYRRPPSLTSSGMALERPPAPTSWINRIGLASPSCQQRSITSAATLYLRSCRAVRKQSRVGIRPTRCHGRRRAAARPMFIAGPPRTTSFAPTLISPFFA